MAIDYSVYVKTKECCIKKHKRDKRFFLFDFRINGKRSRKIFKLITADDKPSVNLVEARLKLAELKGWKLDALVINGTKAFVGEAKKQINAKPEVKKNSGNALKLY